MSLLIEKCGTVVRFCLAAAGIYGYLPGFWALPTSFLTGTAAAASIGLINSIGNLGGFAGPYVVGYLSKRTNSFIAGVLYLSLQALLAFGFVLSLRALGSKRALAVNIPENRNRGTDPLRLGRLKIRWGEDAVGRSPVRAFIGRHARKSYALKLHRCHPTNSRKNHSNDSATPLRVQYQFLCVFRGRESVIHATKFHRITGIRISFTAGTRHTPTLKMGIRWWRDVLIRSQRYLDNR